MAQKNKKDGFKVKVETNAIRKAPIRRSFNFTRESTIQKGIMGAISATIDELDKKGKKNDN